MPAAYLHSLPHHHCFVCTQNWKRVTGGQSVVLTDTYTFFWSKGVKYYCLSWKGVVSTSWTVECFQSLSSKREKHFAWMVNISERTDSRLYWDHRAQTLMCCFSGSSNCHCTFTISSKTVDCSSVVPVLHTVHRHKWTTNWSPICVTGVINCAIILSFFLLCRR